MMVWPGLDSSDVKAAKVPMSAKKVVQGEAKFARGDRVIFTGRTGSHHGTVLYSIPGEFSVSWDNGGYNQWYQNDDTSISLLRSENRNDLGRALFDASQAWEDYKKRTEAPAKVANKEVFMRAEIAKETDRVVARAAAARKSRKNLLGITPGETVRLKDNGDTKQWWLAVNRTTTGCDLYNLATKEFLANCHSSTAILEVRDLELQEEA